MADIATAKKTLDALKKAHNSGDAVKAASLLGTLKVRARNARCAARSFAGAQIWRFHGRDARERRPRTKATDPILEPSRTPTSLFSTTQIAVSSFPALPPVFEQTKTAADELSIARDTFEMAVLHAVTSGNEAAAERDHAQLRPFYVDCRGLMPDSKLEPLITGLNLTRLLVQNRIAEFHVELETVPAHVADSAHVAHAVALESDLMEGAYGKILQASMTPDALPAKEYAAFMASLALTVREEIAACIEKAYESVDAAAAARLMGCAPADVAAVASKRGWRGDGNGGFLFAEEKKAPSAEDIPAHELINQTLMYAKEMERIV